MQATHPPVVLVFEVGAGGIAVDLAVDAVLPARHHSGHVELRRGAATGAVTDVAAVDPDVEGAGYGTEVEDLAVAGLVVRQLKRPVVVARGVAVVFGVPGLPAGGDEGRVGGAEGVLPVNVDGLSEPLHFPVAGHLDSGEIAEVGGVSFRGRRLVAGNGFVAEAPGAVQRRAGAQVTMGAGVFNTIKVIQGSVGRQAVDAEGAGVLHVVLLGADAGAKQGQNSEEVKG